MLHNKLHISKYDPELWEFIEKEMIRQENHIELIASENYASVKVMYMQGSQLTNKYAEGYPEKRYYNGCEYIDMIEKLAISRAKNLFSADYANVQPHSGSQANFAVYYALLKPGDTILGMNLSHGGHLTHGSSINFSGKFYNSIFYGLDKFGNINYEELFSLAKIHKPKLIIGGFSSYSGTVDWKYMRKIADEVGAYLLVDMAHIAGLVAAGLYPNPIPYAHVVTATTHKTLSGPRGGLILSDFKDEEFYKKLNSAVFPGSQGGPLMHVIAAKAIAFKEAMDPSFKFYQIKVIENAKIMAESFLEKKFNLVSKIVYNHLFLLDLTSKNIDGKEASLALSKANIIVNKNSIPNDFRSPIFTSGIRIGTPAITRRGFNKSDSQKLAFWMCDILNNVHNEKLLVEIKKRVLKICKKYPVYC